MEPIKAPYILLVLSKMSQTTLTIWETMLLFVVKSCCYKTNKAGFVSESVKTAKLADHVLT